jgi:predicted nucleic acid-binding protein
MTVFLDTVGLLAVRDESDQWHPRAQACFTQLCGVRANFIATTFILLECGMWQLGAPIARRSVGWVSKWRTEIG